MLKQKTEPNSSLENIKPRKKNISSWAFLLVLLFSLSSCYVTLVTFLTKHNVYTDTTLIYMSSYLLNKGENPYVLPQNLKELIDRKHLKKLQLSNAKNKITGKVKHTTVANLSPPFATMLVSVFSRLMTEQHFSLSIRVMNILVSLIALYILAHYFFKKQKWRAYLCLVLMDFAFMGTVYNFSFGEIALLLNFLLIISCFLYKNKKDISAGAILSFAANLKLFFGLFLLLFLAQKRYKALTSFVLVGLLFGSLPFFIYGITPYHGYLKALSEVYWYPINWNASYLGMISRIFGDYAGRFPSLWHAPVVTSCIYYSIFTIYVVFIYKFCRKLKQDCMQAFALFIPCMLLLSPLGWYYYFPLLILSFVHYFKKIQASPYYLYYFFLLLSLLLILNLPIGLQTKSTTSLGFQLTSASYFFACLIIFHIAQIFCYLVKSKKSTDINIKASNNKLLSNNLLLLLFSVVFITSTSLGFLSFVLHMPDNHTEISFVNTPEQPFTIVVAPDSELKLI